MVIPFTKAHGAGNDFLLSPSERVSGNDLPSFARAICNRHTGIGADGWILMDGSKIRLFNSDGSEPEMSGNGTRCAAALLLTDSNSQEVTIKTGAGPKRLRLIERIGRHFLFEMDMGRPKYNQQEIRFQLPLRNGKQEVTLVNVGNPQCL